MNVLLTDHSNHNNILHFIVSLSKYVIINISLIKKKQIRQGIKWSRCFYLLVTVKSVFTIMWDSITVVVQVTDSLNIEFKLDRTTDNTIKFLLPSRPQEKNQQQQKVDHQFLIHTAFALYGFLLSPIEMYSAVLFFHIFFFLHYIAERNFDTQHKQQPKK